MIFAIIVFCASVFNTNAAVLSPQVSENLNSLSDTADAGMTIIAFNTSNGLNESHLNILRGIGINVGYRFNTLGMVGTPMTVGQIRALSGNPNVRAIWSNDKLQYFMNEARVVAGVERLRTDSGFTARNLGLPVSGKGDFSVMVIDSGVDATHADLQFGSKVIQNVQTLVGYGTLPGFTSNISIENVQNTDQTVGHGTHCAGIIGGTGVRSGGLYAGVAPGAKIIGSGLGAGLFVLNAIAAWEWGLSNQYLYNIRVISNSYGGTGDFNPNNPITIATKMAYDRNIAVVFAAGNSGPGKGTYNPYAKAPWVIGVAAGTKEGGLAEFSSRGLPSDERLTNETTLDDFDAPTITAPGTGREFESNAGKFMSDIVSVRSITNLSANGTTADLDLPVSAIPFYTQISGTSMATPFVAGTIALMLDADPTLSVDEIRSILTTTASRMPGYDDFEVGSGYLNAYAAVDKVFNRGKQYRNIQYPAFNATFEVTEPAGQSFHIDYDPTGLPGEGSVNSTNFTVDPDMNVLDVFATFDNIIETGDGNTIGILLTDPEGNKYSSGIALPILDGTTRQVVVKNPIAGQWLLEIRGARGLAALPNFSLPTSGAALPGPVDGTIRQKKFILPAIADIQGNSAQNDIETSIKSRYMDIYADGTFRPNADVLRGEFAKTLWLNTELRQKLGSSAKFTDVSGDLAVLAEYVTNNGSTNRDYDFTPSGLMNFSGTNFNPAGTVSRLDMAVAFVRALGYDALARSKANQPVTFGGQPLTDNSQIAGSLRGYVQVAIDKGLFEAFPAEVRNLGNGQFEVLPGPRFEPNNAVKRSALASKIIAFRELFSTGG